MPARLLTALLFLALFAAPAAAAPAAGTIRGQLLDEASRLPVQGALMVLLDESGARRAAVLTGADGRFALAVPAAGRYRVQAERVGYATTLSADLVLGEGETREYPMLVRSRGVAIRGITVRGRARCEVRPGQGTSTQELWEEVRKALAGTAWSQEQGLFTFVVRRWTRDLAPGSLRVQREELRQETMQGSTPFRSAPPAELRDKGWVREDGAEQVFFAPDASALLAPEFLDTHCMRLAAHRSDSTRVGLAFEPVRGRRMPDVRGTLWVDRATAELRELEFSYTGLQGSAYDETVGGSMEFALVPGGAWAVRRWNIRTPIVSETRKTDAAGEMARQRTTLVREEGAEVTEVRSRAGRTVGLAKSGAVEGTVFDSVSAGPLRAARVFLSGTSYAAVTDSTGRFAMSGLLPGRYTLSYSHPRLAELDYVAPPAEVTVVEGSTATVALALPPSGRMQQLACGDSAGAVLFGRVRERGNGVALPSARVTASWRDAAAGRERRAASSTDARGAYRFCSLPAGVPIRVAGEFQSRELASATVSLAAGTPREQLLEGNAGPRRAGATGPVRVSGRLLKRSGTVPPGTKVSLRAGGAADALPGTDRETTTDAAGRFAFAAVPPGEYRLEVADAERGILSQPLPVPGGGAVEVELQLGGGAVALDSLVVTGRDQSRAVQARVQGASRAVTREQVEEWARRGGDVSDVLRRLPGVMLKEGCVGLRSTRLESIDVMSGNTAVCYPATVYVDDQPVQEGQELLLTLTLDQIESIEMLAPPESTGRYGAQGVHGVILVRTRTPGRKQP